MITTEALSTLPADWDAMFPKDIPLPKDGIFELGLVMGGTVSAGAYTAGVIDFLIEALDTWAAQREAHPDDTSIPSWAVQLKAVTGTSGGGVTAAILARALSFKFPPVRKAETSDPKICLQNPLYRIWVEELDVFSMLDTSDLVKGTKLHSLLNPKPLDLSKGLICNYEATFADAAQKRDYVASPLPVFLTLTNLRGIPCSLDMGGPRDLSYVDHADHVRLAVFTQGGNAPVHDNEFGVSSQPGKTGFIGWGDVAEFALGSAAFPGGFPLRPLTRPVTHYRYRPVVAFDSSKMTYNVVQLKVDWKSLALAGSNQVPDHYEFLVADGGMTNNEPISLCRTAISGWTMSNPRDGLKAKRAVLLVDPFADAPALGPTSRSSFVEDLQSLIGTWKDQARYDSRDLALAVSETCFSRFMITAQRDGEDVGGKSIACASVYAFGGFLSKAYRRHDFLLGRKNCQEYLLNKLVLPMDNPLFSTWKANAKPGQIEAWRRMDGEIPSLPIIPLLGDCRNAELPGVYPSGAFNPRSTDFQDALKARLDVLLDRAKSDLAVKEFFIKICLTIGEAFGKRALQEAATAYIEKSLKDWKL